MTCNVDIEVAGRNLSILQTIDGVMSLFSMMANHSEMRNDSGYMEHLVPARTYQHARLPWFVVVGGEAGAGQCAESLPEGTIRQTIQIRAVPAVLHNLQTAACYGKRRVRGLRTSR